VITSEYSEFKKTHRKATENSTPKARKKTNLNKTNSMLVCARKTLTTQAKPQGLSLSQTSHLRTPNSKGLIAEIDEVINQLESVNKLVLRVRGLTSYFHIMNCLKLEIPTIGVLMESNSQVKDFIHMKSTATQNLLKASLQFKSGGLDATSEKFIAANLIKCRGVNAYKAWLHALQRIIRNAKGFFENSSATLNSSTVLSCSPPLVVAHTRRQIAMVTEQWPNFKTAPEHIILGLSPSVNTLQFGSVEEVLKCNPLIEPAIDGSCHVVFVSLDTITCLLCNGADVVQGLDHSIDVLLGFTAQIYQWFLDNNLTSALGRGFTMLLTPGCKAVHEDVHIDYQDANDALAYIQLTLRHMQKSDSFKKGGCLIKQVFFIHIQLELSTYRVCDYPGSIHTAAR
jgi:hypothetical protein